MFSTKKRVLSTALGIIGVGLVPATAFAQAGAASNSFDMQAAATLGAAIAIGLAVLGGALGATGATAVRLGAGTGETFTSRYNHHPRPAPPAITSS